MKLAAPRLLVLLLALLTAVAPAHAAPKKKPATKPDTSIPSGGSLVQYQNRTEVQAFIADMAAKHGFVESELSYLFSRVRFYPGIVQLITPPANPRVRSWQAYRGRFLDNLRISGGVTVWRTHGAALARAEKEYGVPAEIIVAIMGVETIYGRNTGGFRVIDALTTLAFDYPRRADFFRDELENYLLFAREEGLDIFTLKGSYAGAIGIPQFMPSSWRKWAVDFDGDGKIDLRNSYEDAIGSVANFLKQHGWVAGAPIAFPARVEGEGWHELLDRDILPSVKVTELPKMGVASEALQRQGLPDDTLCALIDLMTPDAPTEYWVGLQNFYVITRYNRSSFYAMSVMELAQAIKQARNTKAEPLESRRSSSSPKGRGDGSAEGRSEARNESGGSTGKAGG